MGMIVGLAAHSRVVSTGFGSYGAAMSIYYHFLARGRDVVYPKDMAMVIGLGTRDGKTTSGLKQSHQFVQLGILAAGEEVLIGRNARHLLDEVIRSTPLSPPA